MKKLVLPLIGSALLLASCGGGSTPPARTLYQGVWGWATADANGQIVDAGAVILFDEAENEGRKVAAGVYANEAETRSGATLLGPITAAGALETAFTYDTTSDTRLYLVASDEDGRLETTEDGPFFFGPGAFLDRATQQPNRAVYVGLLQLSDEVPAEIRAQTTARNDARALAASAVQRQFRSAGFQAQSLKTGALQQTAQNIFERR